jgi:hypothetical protein
MGDDKNLDYSTGMESLKEAKLFSTVGCPSESSTSWSNAVVRCLSSVAGSSDLVFKAR